MFSKIPDSLNPLLYLNFLLLAVKSDLIFRNASDIATEAC